MAARNQLSLLSLPDELLRKCLACLRVDDRRRAQPLVCRRLQRLVEEPGLNSSVSVELSSSANWRRRMESLCTWVLAGAAAHVQQLSVQLPSDTCHMNIGNVDIASLLSALLTAAGLGGLRELHLGAGALTLSCSGWVWALRRLRRLHIACECGLPITASLQGLGALEELHLDCSGSSGLELMPSALLPPSITRLHLGFAACSTGVPPQVASLTRLHSLSLAQSRAEADSYSQLSRLRSLRHLALTDNRHAPDCLASLSGLEALCVVNEVDILLLPPAAGEAVQQMLPNLVGLTFLALTSMPGMEDPPVALTHLACLRSFYWVWCEPGSRTARLPAGAWLAGLQCLAVPAELLANSLPALPLARQLEHVVIFQCGPYVGGAEAEPQAAYIHKCMRTALQWAARHPMLRTLELQADEGLLKEAASIVGRNPRLRLVRHDDMFGSTRIRELCLGPA